MGSTNWVVSVNRKHYMKFRHLGIDWFFTDSADNKEAVGANIFYTNYVSETMMAYCCISHIH